MGVKIYLTVWLTVAALDSSFSASLSFGAASSNPPGSSRQPQTNLEKAPLCPPQVNNVSYYFPNPYNCSTYYLCSNGVPYEQACPAGLEFDVNKSVCAFPEDADCVEAPHQFIYPKVCEGGAIIANPYDCSSFLYCTGDDYADVISCPAPLLFNAEIGVCDWPDSVTCTSVIN